MIDFSIVSLNFLFISGSKNEVEFVKDELIAKAIKDTFEMESDSLLPEKFR